MVYSFIVYGVVPAFRDDSFVKMTPEILMVEIVLARRIGSVLLHGKQEILPSSILTVDNEINRSEN